MALNQCERAFSCAARDLVGFDDIDEKLKRERHYRHIRRDYSKIVETLGEQHFKIPALNKQVYVCGIDDDDYPQRYISTDKVLPSPPISATPSAKSSVAKSEVSAKISSMQMG